MPIFASATSPPSKQWLYWAKSSVNYFTLLVPKWWASWKTASFPCHTGDQQSRGIQGQKTERHSPCSPPHLAIYFSVWSSCCFCCPSEHSAELCQYRTKDVHTIQFHLVHNMLWDDHIHFTYISFIALSVLLLASSAIHTNFLFIIQCLDLGIIYGPLSKFCTDLLLRFCHGPLSVGLNLIQKLINLSL